MEYKPKQKKTTLEKRERFTNRLPYPIFIFGNPNSFYSHDTDRKKYTYTNLKWKQKNIYKNLHENDSRIKTECLNFAKNTYILLIKSMQKELNKTMKNGSRNNNTNKKKTVFLLCILTSWITPTALIIIVEMVYLSQKYPQANKLEL